MFVGGWAITIYLAFFTSGDFPNSLEFRLNVLLGHGISVTTAAALLWGVAAYIWIRLLPEAPPDG